MLRGTRIFEAEAFNRIIDCCRWLTPSYTELIIPSIWEQDLFVEKAGEEILNQMYAFNDKSGRNICLIPEVTAIIQQQWKERWSKEKKKPYRISYLSRCYRYERPQQGRYREFWQFGCEILGGDIEQTKKESIETLTSILKSTGVPFEFNSSVKRGLNYYIEDGFEAICKNLGAQQQIAGGGCYEDGVGFAIGIDRILLALENKS